MQNVGRYKLLGRLGRGGMSTVYKAQAPVTKRTVALKILLPRDEIFIDLVGEQRLRELFVEEARIMGEISHEHVAKILDCHESGETPYIVLEYFAHSVGSLIGEAYQVEKKSRIISLEKTFEYLSQSLRGLERLHFAGIIHRDIKPYNLMITQDDRIKIIDFGLSRVRGEEKIAIPGMQVGSPYYAAPEQERDPKGADERADLFSVGVMAYRLVTGNLINIRGEIPRPSSLNHELDDMWDDFLLKSISIKREKRFSSAHEMRFQLEEVYANWRRNSKPACRFQANDQAGPQLTRSSLRSAPSFIRYKELQARLNLDSLMRPRIFSAHRFQYRSKRLLECIDTDLIWQREGSGFTLTWQMAHAYIDYLNKRKWQGISSWRLPTVDELNTLLRSPTLLRDYYLEDHFPDDIHWIWSSDTCTKKKAWMVDLKESYFQALDKDGIASVCAVCTIASL